MSDAPVEPGTDSGLRLPDAVADALTPEVVGLLEDPEMTNVNLCPSGAVTTMRRGGGWRVEALPRLSQRRLDLILAAVAGSLGTVNDRRRPITQGSLCGSRVRVTGFGPSVGDGRRSLVFRIQPARALELDELVDRGMLSASWAEILVERVASNGTVIFAGPTNSGKTTLARAVLRAYLERRPLDRVVTLEEQSPELALDREAEAGGTVGVGVLPLVAHAEGSDVDLERLLRAALRANADSVVVGEVRGAEAYVLLRALRSGHRGSVATLHAGSTREALEQLATFASDAGVRVDARAWADLVDVVVCLDERDGRREVLSLETVSVDDDGRWKTRRIE